MATSASLNVVVSSKGVDTTKKKLKGLTTESQKTEKNVVKLQNGFKGFGKNAAASIAAIDGPLGGISSRISALTTVATAGGLAMTTLAVAVTAAVGAISKGVKELDELNIALARSEALINATGGAAGFTALQLQEQARQTAYATLASVQGIQQAQSVLLTFKNVSGTVFNEAISLAQDMATVFGGTAASAATQLGKALNDPITGVTALTRAGITFSDQQKDQIKALTQSGEVIKAQALIVQELKEQIGGVAEAVAKETLAGSLDTLGQAFDELTIEIAKSVGALGTVQYVVNRIASGMQRATEALQPETSAEAFSEALELYFKIAEEEAKLADMNDGIVKRSQEAKIERLKAERQELLAYAQTASETENKIRMEAGEAQAQAIALQKARAKADAEAAAASSRKRALESSELSSFQTQTQKIQRDWEERVRIAQVSGMKIDDASKAQFVAEAEESISYENQLTALEQYYNSAREKAQGQNDILSQIDSEYKTAMETLELDHQANLTEIRKTAAEERKEQAQQEAIELQQAYSSLAGAVSNSFGSAADAIAASGDTASAAYTTMWALSKGFATAQAALNFQLALSQALALPSDVTLAQKFASYAAVLSAGSSLVSSISSISYSGRAQGGQTNPNGTYMVGERGPELVTFGRDGGSVMSNSQMQQQSSGNQRTNYTVVNQTSGTINEVEQQNVTANDVVLILRETMPAEIKNSNSGTSKALSRNTNSKRRYR